MQIQGSGIGILPNKKEVKLAFDGSNNLKYTSIGKFMIKKKIIPSKQVSMHSIKNWLYKNPNMTESILNQNKRYIFFKFSTNTNGFAKGAFNTQLIPGISIAIDKKIYPYGLTFLMQTNENFNDHLVISHDTGKAIIGANRADIFLGKGKVAENIAGNLNQNLILFVLVPKGEKSE